MAISLILELERIGIIAELEEIGSSVPVSSAKPSKFSNEYETYLKSDEWRARRERITPRLCGGCNTAKSLQLHHRRYPPKGSPFQAFVDQPDSEFTWLCELCHSAITTSMRRRRKRKRK